jgi:glyoxylase-like metal-dependent hydrolase (beta-lactamase superfamily II)
MNMTLLETAEDILVIDAGLMFPEEDMLGIDLVLPDATYLLEQRDKVRGIVLTHGHEDHTGGLPYLLPELSVPVYGTCLSLGLVQEKLREFGLDQQVALRPVRAGDRLLLGALEIEFIRVSHSIPDGVAVAVRTSAGLVVPTGDFKFDDTPVDGGWPTSSGLPSWGTTASWRSVRQHQRLPRGVDPVGGDHRSHVRAAVPGRPPPTDRGLLCQQHPSHPAGAGRGRALGQEGRGQRQEHDGQSPDRRRAGISAGAAGDAGAAGRVAPLAARPGGPHHDGEPGGAAFRGLREWRRGSTGRSNWSGGTP